MCKAPSQVLEMQQIRQTGPCYHGIYNQLSGGEDIKHTITKVLNYQKATSWNPKNMHWGALPRQEGQKKFF